ncbi:MAG: Dna2/Cas4 domain-containing protein [Anaerolineales bacterium]|nr:MAG: Dna2/Cas4 domain-containing protein [Anaerolineales bacterium]
MGPLQIAVLFVLLGLCLFLFGNHQRANLPRGRIIYIDSKHLKFTPDNLYDPETGLVGRPDYLIQRWHTSIPVELKSSTAPSQPHAGHILQLAAYCHLVEVESGRRPSHGVIRYRDQSFRIDYTRALRRNLFKTLETIRNMEGTTPDRSHKFAIRCRACGFQPHCDQTLI